MHLHPALQRRLQEQAQLLEIARRYARKLSERLPVRWAIVAGSVARGDFNAGSDIDVLVLSDALPSHPLRRAELLYDAAVGGVEPKGLTVAEFARELRRRNPLALEAVELGVVVYPEGATVDELRQDLGSLFPKDADGLGHARSPASYPM